VRGKAMADTNPARALDVVRRIEMMCDFIELPAIKTAAEQTVPYPVPKSVGALGFDIPFWVGFGMVGLWAALDAFSERAALRGSKCKTCRSHCMPERFASYAEGNELQSLRELEDLRHLYAHNYAGEADDEYFSPKHPRHVLKRGVPVQLSCGGEFNASRPSLGLSHLREYCRTVKDVLDRVSRSTASP
jgi:hypothetical protein